jgi:hypothetical protein
MASHSALAMRAISRVVARLTIAHQVEGNNSRLRLKARKLGVGALEFLRFASL